MSHPRKLPKLGGQEGSVEERGNKSAQMKQPGTDQSVDVLESVFSVAETKIKTSA
jgi:hypothetical protein